MAARLERALVTVLRGPVELTVAGRTDRGVHALGQVVSYRGPAPALRSVNAVLPRSIAVLAVEQATAGFSARHDALTRRYAYRVLARATPSPFEQGRALWWPHPVDLSALEACAQRLVGVRDFTAFTPAGGYHRHFRRDVVAASWRREHELLVFEIEADAFMRHMNRVLVGTMLEVAGGRRSLNDFERLLTGRPRSEAGPTAPPHGLYLTAVRY